MSRHGVMMWLAVTALAVPFVPADIRAEPPAKPAAGSVQVMFLPPPLETAVYSVGIYETKTGRLVRRLHEDAGEDDFTAALNGFITFWDRRDDDGKTVPAGRYAARGWAVGEMRVEGVDILGNDWAAEDESLRVTRVSALGYVEDDNGLIVLVAKPDGGGELLRLSGKDGAVLWHRDVPYLEARFSFDDERHEVDCLREEESFAYTLANGRETRHSVGEINSIGRLPVQFCAGLHGTYWIVRPEGLFEIAAGDLKVGMSSRGDTEANIDGPLPNPLRSLLTQPGEPPPRAVAMSRRLNRLYLLENLPGWQRVRGLEWAETKQEAGQSISEWKTFFERNIRRPDPALDLDEKAPSPVVEFPLAKNPLDPGKPQRARLRAGFDAAGSYLETADGLRLLPVSARPNLCAARLARDPQDSGRLRFSQFDGAAWDVFSLIGAPAALVSFDAGEFELSAEGERRPPPPATEPRDP